MLNYYTNWYIFKKNIKGCQATVKKVKEVSSDNIYAAKIFIHMNDDEVKSVIRNEFETLKQLDHPNIIKVKELIE